jgi:hypothetical protein
VNHAKTADDSSGWLVGLQCIDRARLSAPWLEQF